MIKYALENPNVTVSVLATPSVRDFAKNTLSTRLKLIYVNYPEIVDGYCLYNIGVLACFVKNKNRAQKWRCRRIK